MSRRHQIPAMPSNFCVSGSFNLIICDLRMPDCDGLNLLQAIRSAGNEIPVIILTAYGEVDTYLEAMNAGATEYSE